MKVKVLLYSGQQANQSCDLTAVERRWMHRLTYNKVAVLLIKHTNLRTTGLYSIAAYN